MFISCWYKFFDSPEQALAVWNEAFVNTNRVNYAQPGLSWGCFGSYGGAFSANPTGDFFFSISAFTQNSESAVNFFNKHFKNIQFEIVAKTVNRQAYDSFTGTNEFTEKGWEELISRRKVSQQKEYYQYLYHISFHPDYAPLAKYVLRIPLGFWIRMFTAYTGSNGLDHPEDPHTRNPIRSAVHKSNSQPGRNSSLMSDYILKYETFLAMDDIDRMNQYFSEPLPKVQYLRPGTAASLTWKNSIKPYCVYYVIEHEGSVGDVTPRW